MLFCLIFLPDFFVSDYSNQVSNLNSGQVKGLAGPTNYKLLILGPFSESLPASFHMQETMLLNSQFSIYYASILIPEIQRHLFYNHSKIMNIF